MMVGSDGNGVAFNGVYKEIVAPERIVNTEICEIYPDHPSLCTMTLVERAGQTHYQTIVEHDSKEACDGHLASGMETGAAVALDRVEEIAQSLAGSNRGAAAAGPPSRAST
jgi:uncharacterized protein YndB with AHSA1/START domain